MRGADLAAADARGRSPVTLAPVYTRRGMGMKCPRNFLRRGHAMRILRGLSLVLVALVSTAAIGAMGARPAGLQLAADPNGRFTIRFPSDWQVVKTKSGPSTVVGLGPAPPGEFQTNVNVVVEDLAAPVSPATYARLAGQKMATAFQDFTVLSEGSATIAHRQAYYRYYTWRRSTGGVLYQVQTYFTLGRRAFVLTGTTINNVDRIRRDVPVIGQIFETFSPTTR